MKKITALVLALMMTCLMTCAFAAEADPLYTGEWYLKTMQNGDDTIDVAAMGLNGVMTLNADWTCSMTGMGNDVTGTWKDEADKNKITVTMDGDDADVMLSDGELTVSAGETKMIFTREAPAAAGSETAEIKADATAEEFNGNWTCIALSVGSMKLDAATAKAAGQELPTLCLQDAPELRGRHLQLRHRERERIRQGEHPAGRHDGPGIRRRRYRYDPVFRKG